MRSLAEDAAVAKERLTPVSEVGFGVAPSFFQGAASQSANNPSKVAEWHAAKKRMAAYNYAAQSLRTAAEALHRFKALDATGQLVAGIEHFDAHVSRAEEASDVLLTLAELFAKEHQL